MKTIFWNDVIMSHMKRHHLWVDNSCCCLLNGWVSSAGLSPGHLLCNQFKTWFAIGPYVVDCETWEVKKLLYCLYLQKRWHMMPNVALAVRKLRVPFIPHLQTNDGQNTLELYLLQHHPRCILSLREER